MMTPLEQVIYDLYKLTPQQLAQVQSIVQTLLAEVSDGYDESKDFAIGFVDGPIDLAENLEEILYQDISPTSGWTQKADSV